MLDVNIKARNIELTEWLQQYVEKKIGKMDRYLPMLEEADVELRREGAKNTNHRNVAQVTLRGGRTIIRGEERASDMSAAIDAVVDTLYRQIARYKGKRQRRTRTSQRQAQPPDELPPLPADVLSALEEEAPPRIVRVKHFAMHPMDEEEAIEQMELLGHDFFVFFNVNAGGRVNVVYRRKAGDYGLIDPELG